MSAVNRRSFFYNIYLLGRFTMKKHALILTLLPTILLTGCNKPTFKCSYESFKKSADKAASKAPEIESISYEGIIGVRGYKFSVVEGHAESVAKLNEDELSVYNFTSLYRRVDSFTNEKHDEFTYAYGLAYSVSSDTQKFVYNLKGYLETYAESTGIIAHFTIKYQYKK